MGRKKKTHLMFLLLALLCVGAAQAEKCPSDPDIARTDLSCESDYNRTITCLWNSTSASDLPDNVCTLKASLTSKYVSYNAECKLEPVDVSRPTLRKCTLIFNKDSRFKSYDNLLMDLNCNPGNQTLKVYFKPACHIKLNPPPQPRINFTTASWFPQVVYNLRLLEETYGCQLQWKHLNQSWSESNVLDTSCKRDCSVELNLDELKQGERYEARVRAKTSENDYKSMWSDWSPTASWVSPIGGTKEPPPARTDLSCESDYNRIITCVWNSTSASDLPDNVCTLKASKTSKWVSYNAECKLEPVDVSRPTLRKCTLIFNKDSRFQSLDNLLMDLNCNPGNQTLKVYFKPACHIKLNPPPQPRINFTTASWFPQVVYNLRLLEETYGCQLQWKHLDQSWSESNVLDTSCKRDCSVELNLDELKQGERYEARVRAKTSGNDYKSMWSDWSPTASWVSPIGGTKEPPPARTDLSCESDYNRIITCVWNSTSASDLPDNVCTLKASKTSKWVSYNAECKLEPVDVSRPTLRKCTLIFNKDSRFQSYDNLLMDLNCNPGNQTLKVYFKPACHIKLNPPPQPRINFTTASWFPQVVYNLRLLKETYGCQLQWKHQNQSWSESNVLDTSCKRDCSVELNLDELIQGQRYEARVRAKTSGNDYKSMWSDWSPTASWVSP